MPKPIAVLIVVFLLSSREAFGFIPSILEMVIGPRLGGGPKRIGRSVDVHQAVRIIENFGYRAETHEVLTEDGYMLVLHRIPRGRYKRDGEIGEPVVVQPGLFGASDCWIFRGPEQDLSYQLADAGYDVWLANPRGNVYSRRHRSLDPNNDAAFWNYTAHESGIYDLASTIDYILATTSRTSLHLIGYSLGSTSALALLSVKPEYNGKVKILLNLGPLAYPRHELTPTVGLTFQAMPLLTHILESQDIQEVFPRRDLMRQLVTISCRSSAPTYPICSSLLWLTVGGEMDQFNSSAFPAAFHFFPGGTSVKTMKHVGQLYNTGDFKPLDENDLGFTTEYNLSKITVPVSIHYGSADNLVGAEDVRTLSSKLSNVVEIQEVNYGKFGHMDYMWPSDINKVKFFRDLIKLMDKYR